MRIMVALAVLFAALPFSAQAQTVQQTFRKFGLIGVWAHACDQPASADSNTHAIYALSGTDGVMVTYDNGPRYKPSVYTVLSAERVGRDRLVYVEQRLNTNVRATVTVRKFSHRIGIVSSVLENGKVLIENGKFAKTGKDNPRLSLCHKLPAPAPAMKRGMRGPPAPPTAG